MFSTTADTNSATSPIMKYSNAVVCIIIMCQWQQTSSANHTDGNVTYN